MNFNTAGFVSHINTLAPVFVACNGTVSFRTRGRNANGTLPGHVQSFFYIAKCNV